MGIKLAKSFGHEIKVITNSQSFKDLIKIEPYEMVLSYSPEMMKHLENKLELLFNTNSNPDQNQIRDYMKLL